MFYWVQIYNNLEKIFYIKNIEATILFGPSIGSIVLYIIEATIVYRHQKWYIYWFLSRVDIYDDVAVQIVSRSVVVCNVELWTACFYSIRTLFFRC